ncbi:unnamed protein product [Adineta steineri]|uniref:RING-type domain-containing protein n=1 Tax=Adineta steineri TaxID=433720 RepID=A0A815IKS5_9BILA|nr:unnamed protein product [Adineta steineri]
MRAQDQEQSPPAPAALPPAPAALLPAPAALPQQLAGHPQEQLLQIMCAICFENIQRNEAVIYCNVCGKPFHHGELITWLTIAPANGPPRNCPVCRGNMGWVFILVPVLDNLDENIPLGLQPADLPDGIDNWNWDLDFL